MSARIKSHKILVIFETTNQFSFKIFYQSWVPLNITSLYFLSWSIIYFGQKQPIKVQIFEIFECLGQNLLNSSCRFELVNSFSNFASFFIVILHNSLVNFKLIHFLLGINLAHKIPNFEPHFQVLWLNFPDSSCYFLNHELVFLQILHHSLVSWKITPLYFFRSNIAYFSWKEQIKV